MSCSVVLGVHLGKHWRSSVQAEVLPVGLPSMEVTVRALPAVAQRLTAPISRVCV